MRTSSPARGTLRVLSVPGVVLLVVTVSHSQGPAGPIIRGAGRQDMQSREWALTHISDEINKHFARQNKPSLPEMREDFHQLQVANNELMKLVFVNKLTEPKQIRASISEIRKRASRLQTNLALGNSDYKTSKAGSDAPPESVELSSSLLQLDRAVMDFVNNPMFQQPKVLDTKLVIQAGNELNEVLRLADVIDRLAKHTQSRK